MFNCEPVLIFCGCLTPKLVPLSNVARRALALAADVVTQAAVTARALLRAVNTKGPKWTWLRTDGTLEGGGASQSVNKMSFICRTLHNQSLG